MFFISFVGNYHNENCWFYSYQFDSREHLFYNQFMDHYINPASDIFIRFLWGSEKNKAQTLSFINGVMCDSGFPKLVSLEIKNPFNLKTFEADKETILDIKAEDERGRLYNIEVQSEGTHIYKHRSLYYWARLYSGQLDEGNAYNKLKSTICINLMSFILFNEIPHIHSCFLLRDIKNPDYILTDHLMLHFIELPKFKKEEKVLNPKLYNWLYFLVNEGKEEDEMMKILLSEDEDIKRAHKEYQNFTRDERMKQIYEARHKRKLDELSALYEAEQKGKLEGKLEGIIGMYEAGVSIEKIAQGMKMSIEEVKQIVKDPGNQVI